MPAKAHSGIIILIESSTCQYILKTKGFDKMKRLVVDDMPSMR